MNAMLALMIILKIISIPSALAGYANSGLLTVVTLFMVAQGITSTGGADFIVSKLLGTSSDIMLAQVRMCLITAVFSSFVNDTPVFCIMLPIVLTWATQARLNIRQLLIPLSYCSLLGGLNTSIGTSTNLVVTGQFNSKVLDPDSEYYQPGLSPIALFDITPYGLPNVIWGIMYLMIAAPFLLPGGAGKSIFKKYKRALSRKPTAQPMGGDDDESSEFFIGLIVADDSPVIGSSVLDAGLRNLKGQYLVTVRRDNKLIHAVGPDFTLDAGDVLYFAGVPDGIDALAAEHGLTPYSDALEEVGDKELPGFSAAFGVDHISVPKSPLARPSPRRSSSSLPGAATLELVEARIVKGASIAGQTIRACSFRSRFHAAVVSIKRNQKPVLWSGPVGTEVLQEGDELLLDVAPQFWTTPEVNQVFEDVGPSGQVKSHNEFMVPMRVTGGTVAGKTVLKAGLRQLPSAFLVSIERKGITMHAVSSDEILEVGDTLWFAGSAGSVKFIRNIPGLSPLAEKHASRLKGTAYIERRLVQAIVAQGSPLCDKTPAEVDFREHFNAAIVAVARKGQRIRSKPGEVVLKAGDILLLDTGGSFSRLHNDSKYFSTVIEMENTNPPRFFHTAIAVAAIAAAFILYAVEVLDILPGAVVVVTIMLLTGCMSPDQARKSIKWDVYVMIAGSFGVSTAMEQSGAAAAIANGVISIGQSAGGSTFIIAAIYMATMLMSQVISNNSAAALIFPIAATISKNNGIDIYILSYSVMLGASSVFMSSFGYQTNLMAMAAGGHSSRDFLKIGTPMQVVLAAVSIASLSAGEDKWPFVWLVTGCTGAVVLSAPQVMEWIRVAKKTNKS